LFFVQRFFLKISLSIFFYGKEFDSFINSGPESKFSLSEKRRVKFMSIKGPLRKEGILSRKLGDEWILYDTEKGSIHIINTMAEFVWKMCDGSHTLDEMEKRIEDAYYAPEGATLKRDLENIIQSFANMGLFVSQ